MAAKQHFNNFMIVVSGSRRERSQEREREEDRGFWEGGKYGVGMERLEEQGPKRE